LTRVRSAYADLSRALDKWQYWKPVTLVFDEPGVWRVVAASDPPGSDSSRNACTPQSTCVCASLANPGDPYCGAAGAACRAQYP